MRCPKCYSDDMHATGYRCAPDGIDKDIYKCWDCGGLLELDRAVVFQRHLGKMGLPCRIVQMKNGVIVDYYRSIRNAAMITGQTAYMIEKCINGAIDNVDGYVWRRI